MTANEPKPLRARGMPPDDARPQSLPERRRSLGMHLLRRAKQRRERFIRRTSTFSLRKELARSAYLTGCVLFDGLVLPEPIFLLPSFWGWIVSLPVLVVAVWAEVHVYQALFSLRESPQTQP